MLIRATFRGMRARPRSPYDGRSRQPTAAATAAKQVAATPVIHTEPASVPVPSAWTRATGQSR